ncbi:MAG: type 1 glutamine amidotransferase [Halobacteriales archaeon]
MDRPRLALLNASFWHQTTSRNFRRELDADLVEYDVTEGELPANDDVDGVVITGSGAAVYDTDTDPWIDPLLDWIESGIDRGLPFLGICFGHQALAVALGGTVEAMDATEVGYREIEQVADCRLFDGVPDPFTVFTTHSDTVTELPPDATLIAENDYGVQGFRQDRIFGVQSHPEYDMETARAIIEDKDLPEERTTALLEGVTDAAFAEACKTKQLFDNFTDHVLEVPTTEPEATVRTD